ncbi:MAG: YitT family protein [Oscillospiraceae bacterium]|jgi:uncharacterized membrane-anchored protein YitT (DUF2179 family)
MTRDRLLQLISIYAKIIIGSAIYAAGFIFFLYPNSIVTGGVTGVAMIVNYLTRLPVGLLVIILNIPLFALAWKKFGTAFMLSSLVGMVASSILMDVFGILSLAITSDSLLASVYGGFVTGVGLGLVLSANASTGGVDIVAKLLRRRYQYINFGTLILLLDAVIIAVFAVISRKYDSAMFAIISMFIASKVIDFVLYGAASCKVCYIITDESMAVRDAITRHLDRGVTFLRGEGGYSGREKQVILCVIKYQQIVDLKRLVREIDENAFIIISESREVFGNGFLSIHSND